MARKRLGEAVRTYWPQLLPMWLCFPTFFVAIKIVNGLAVPEGIALPLVAVTMFPFFLWSFGRAWVLVMKGHISRSIGILLVLVPPLPLGAAMGYFLNVILPSLS